jgi:hypothetical protein
MSSPLGQTDVLEHVSEKLTERPLSGHQFLHPLLLVLAPPSSGLGLLSG